MKVLCISEYYPPKAFGGGEIGAEALAKNLASFNEIVVLTSYFPGLRRLEEKENVKIIRELKTSPPGTLMDEIKRIIQFKKSMEKTLPRILKEEGPDIIHCLNTSSIEAVSDIETGIPRVATINSYRNLCPKANLFLNERGECGGAEFKKCIHCLLISKYLGKVRVNPFLKLFLIPLLYKQYERRNRSLESMDRLIAISTFIREVLINAGVPEYKIIKIPNLIEVAETSKSKIELPKDKVNVTSLSALEKIKSVDILISSFGRMKGEGAALSIVGAGSEEGILRDLVRRLGIANKVNFLGQVRHDETPAIYAQSDIIAIPSRWPEPLPRVGIEALYFGKPIIATDVGGNRDLVENGKNGFLVDVDGGEFTKKLEQLVQDEKLRRKMGENSRKLFEKKFKKKRIIESITQVYEQVGESIKDPLD